MQKSTKSRRSRKAKKSHQDAKPYPEFPLTLHTTGRWVKKHNGKRYYFGIRDDWEGALREYERQWPYILAGKTPPPTDPGKGLTIAELCDEFLNAKRQKLETGECLKRQSFTSCWTRLICN